MSKPSNWPLDPSSYRLVAPVLLREQLERNPLTHDCFPLAVGHYKSAHGHKMQRKRHDDCIIIHCIEGTGWLRTADWSGNISAGDLIMIPRGIPHEYAASKTDPWSINWCHYSGTLAEAYLNHMGFEQRQPVRKVGLSPTLQTQFKQLLSTSSSGFNLQMMVHAANSLKQLLSQIAVLLMEQRENLQRSFDLNQVQAHMLQNLDRSLSLDELAKLANLSRYHFSKKYQQQTGKSPIKHFLEMKMEYACYLLETSELSIQEIAWRVGYDDNLYFSRAFKKAYTLSPKNYRKQSTN